MLMNCNDSKHDDPFADVTLFFSASQTNQFARLTQSSTPGVRSLKEVIYSAVIAGAIESR